VDGPLLDLGHTTGNAHHHTRAATERALALVHFMDKVVEHFLGDIKVRDHTVTQRADGDDVPRGPPDHLFRLGADRQGTLASLVDGDHGRLVDDDALAIYAD